MANQHARGRFHPSRTSGTQKFLRKHDYDQLMTQPKRKTLTPLQIKGGDWSLRKGV